MNSQFLQDILSTDGVNKGEQVYISSSEDAFSISAVIGFSSRRIYRLLETTKTNSSNSIKGFYFKLYETKIKEFTNEENLPVLVCNNWIINKSAEIKEFLKESWVQIVIIPPYNPCLNDCENLIGWIKNQLKSQIACGK